MVISKEVENRSVNLQCFFFSFPGEINSSNGNSSGFCRMYCACMYNYHSALNSTGVRR